MKECINQVRRVRQVCITGLGAIAATLIPFTSSSQAQSVNIDGLYFSGLANTCSVNEGGTFSPDVWNCMAGATSMTLMAQTGRAQPTLNGAYLSSVGDYCSASTDGSFTPVVWDCMAQSVVDDIPFRQGVNQYCTFVYGFNTFGYRACINRFVAVKQDCYADPQFFALPENRGFCQAPSPAVVVRLYPPGRSRMAQDVRRDRYLTNQCNSLPPAQQQKATACQVGRKQPLSQQPESFVPPSAR